MFYACKYLLKLKVKGTFKKAEKSHINSFSQELGNYE